MTRTATLAPAVPAAPGPDDAVARLRARGRASGALVVTFFGALWAGAGLSGLDAPAWAWVLLSVVATAIAARAIRVLRGMPRVDERTLPADVAARRRRGDRLFHAAVVGEGMGILVAINVVRLMGHPQWQPAAALLVVGLHFLPLASAFDYRPHLVTGLALVAWSLAWPWLFAAGAMAPAGWLVGGAILAASAVVALRAAGR